MPTSVAIAAIATWGGAAIAATNVAAVAVFAAEGWLTLGMISTASTVLISGALSSAIYGGKGGSNSSSSFSAQAQGRDQVVRSGTANRVVVYGRAMVSGPLVFAASSGANNGTLHLVIPLAAHQIDAIEEVYFNDVALGTLDGSGNVTTGTYAGKAQITKHLGVAGDPADAGLIAANVGWTAAHKLSGVAYIVVKLTFDSNVFPTGIPNVKCLIRGKKLYDPRTGTTVWSANPALAVRDYLVSSYGLEVAAAEVDDTLVSAAANICDESVTVVGGTEARFTCNGVIDTGDTPRNNMEAVMSAMAGHMVWTGGKYSIYAGAYTAPAVTLTADDLRGPINVRPRLSRRDLFNAVRGTFVDPTAFWQPVDFPTVSNSTYAANDGNQVIWKDIALPFTTSSATAQRIAKMMMERSRQGITVEMPAKLTAFKIATMDTVMVTLPQLGWSAKEFKVLEWKLAVEGGVDLVLQEETSASYNWNSGMQPVIAPAADTNLPDSFAAPAPGAPAVTESLYQTSGSVGVRSRATVAWNNVQNAFVAGYLPEYKASGSSTWTSLPQTPDITVDLNDLVPGLYDFRVRSVNTLGVKGSYSPTTTKEILGLTAPPASVAGFTVTKVGGVAVGSWTLTDDLDVRIGGRVVIRHSMQTTGATWADGVVLDEFAGDAVSGLLPLITGTYMAKFRDSTGTYSASAVSFLATEGLVSGFNTVATSTQAPTFTGAKTQVAVNGTVLQLDSGTLWDAFTGNMDTWPSLTSYGTLYQTGTYLFDNYVDLATVKTRRVEADVKMYASDSGDLVDGRTALIDAWDDMDGAIINDCDVTLYYAATDDNPAGTPTWSAWTPFFVADITSRAVKFKLDFASGNPTHQIAVSTLTVHVKEAV